MVEDVSSLEANIFIDATENLFRGAMKRAERQPLFSLKYLVCQASSFEVTDPRDTYTLSSAPGNLAGCPSHSLYEFSH